MEGFIGLKICLIVVRPFMFLFKLLFSLAKWLLKLAIKVVQGIINFVVWSFKKIVATIKRKKQQHDVMEGLKSGSMSKDDLAEHLTKTLE